MCPDKSSLRYCVCESPAFVPLLLSCFQTVRLAGVGNMSVLENYLCEVDKKSFHVWRRVFQVDKVFLLEKNLSSEKSPWPGKKRDSKLGLPLCCSEDLLHD